MAKKKKSVKGRGSVAVRGRDKRIIEIEDLEKMIAEFVENKVAEAVGRTDASLTTWRKDMEKSINGHVDERREAREHSKTHMAAVEKYLEGFNKLLAEKVP